MKKIIYILLTLYCITLPFYLFGSGYPQLSDLFLVITFIIFVFNYDIKKDYILIISLIILFLIITINLIWSMVFSSNDFLLSILYYIYSIMILIMILNIFYIDGKKILNVIYKGIYLSVLIQVILSPLLINTGLARQMLLFNNPNQLGYFALLAFSIFTLLFYVLKTNITNYIIISFSTFYLALLSNSSSAILSILFILLIQLILLFIYRLTLIKKLFSVLFLFIIIGVGYSLSGQITSIDLIDNASERITGKEATTSENLYERGYDRIFENKELLVLGAGEGLFRERFNRGELHSTLFSFLFNYGIITTLFLLILFLLLIRKATLIPLIVLISIHFYGITHNGIRQPLFWITNAVIFIGNTEGYFNFKNILNQLKSK